jgi:hypothetical protein
MSISTIGDGYALKNAGDIVSHDGTAQGVVSVGADNYVIKANSSQTHGIQWVGLTSMPSQVFQISGGTEKSSMSGAAAITISSIPQGYDDLLIVASASHSAGASATMVFNSIITSSYAARNTKLYNAGSVRDLAQGTGSLANINEVFYQVGYALGAWELYFPNYSSTGGKSVIYSGSGGMTTLAGAGLGLNFGSASIHSSALSTGITSVTITSSSGVWESGSGYVMYGIKR